MASEQERLAQFHQRALPDGVEPAFGVAWAWLAAALGEDKYFVTSALRDRSLVDPSTTALLLLKVDRGENGDPLQASHAQLVDFEVKLLSGAARLAGFRVRTMDLSSSEALQYSKLDGWNGHMPLVIGKGWYGPLPPPALQTQLLAEDSPVLAELATALGAAHPPAPAPPHQQWGKDWEPFATYLPKARQHLLDNYVPSLGGLNAQKQCARADLLPKDFKLDNQRPVAGRCNPQHDKSWGMAAASLLRTTTAHNTNVYHDIRTRDPAEVAVFVPSPGEAELAARATTAANAWADAVHAENQAKQQHNLHEQMCQYYAATREKVQQLQGAVQAYEASSTAADDAASAALRAAAELAAAADDARSASCFQALQEARDHASKAAGDAVARALSAASLKEEAALAAAPGALRRKRALKRLAEHKTDLAYRIARAVGARDKLEERAKYERAIEEEMARRKAATAEFQKQYDAAFREDMAERQRRRKERLLWPTPLETLEMLFDFDADTRGGATGIPVQHSVPSDATVPFELRNFLDELFPPELRQRYNKPGRQDSWRFGNVVRWVQLRDNFSPQFMTDLWASGAWYLSRIYNGESFDRVLAARGDDGHGQKPPIRPAQLPQLKRAYPLISTDKYHVGRFVSEKRFEKLAERHLRPLLPLTGAPDVMSLLVPYGFREHLTYDISTTIGQWRRERPFEWPSELQLVLVAEAIKKAVAAGVDPALYGGRRMLEGDTVGEDDGDSTSRGSENEDEDDQGEGDSACTGDEDTRGGGSANGKRAHEESDGEHQRKRRQTE